MTYRKLQEWLGKMDNEQLNSDVTFYDSEMGELANGTLDDNHPFFQL